MDNLQIRRGEMWCGLRHESVDSHRALASAHDEQRRALRIEPERAACLKADVGLACYDTKPGAGGGRLRVRPLCLLRGSAGTPFAAHDGQRNVPHESGISSGDLAGGFVARGAHFQETEACETRPTRRRVIKKGFVSAQVGFRCAYDRDPGAGQ
jgi:hypothetical protein